MSAPAFVWPGTLLLAAAFIGAEQCKLCHRGSYLAWEQTPHARAGDHSPGLEESCLRCHGTDGFRGVQCEACHGPGGNYWPAEVMMDPDKATMAGLVVAGEAVCRRCHDNDEPGHRRGFEMPPRTEFPRWIH